MSAPTATLVFNRLSREDCRLVYAALRDKRAQILERERQALGTSAEDSKAEGEQAHRLAALMDCARRAHDQWPMPKASVIYQEAQP